MQPGKHGPFPPPTGVRRRRPWLDSDGRVLLSATTENWRDSAVIFDIRTGEGRGSPLDYVTDFHCLAWTPDGQIMGLRSRLHSTLWKFEPSAR